MHTFALYGELSEGVSIYKFLILLKDRMALNKSNSQEQLDDKDLNEKLIGIIWTLINREANLGS